jgi:hypothetical protein
MKIRHWTVTSGASVFYGDIVYTTLGTGTIQRGTDGLSAGIVGVALAYGSGSSTESHLNRIPVSYDLNTVYEVLGITTTWAATHKGDALDLYVDGGAPSAYEPSDMAVDGVAGDGCCVLIDRAYGPEADGTLIAWGTSVPLKVTLRPLATIWID